MLSHGGSVNPNLFANHRSHDKDQKFPLRSRWKILKNYSSKANISNLYYIVKIFSSIFSNRSYKNKIPTNLF